MKMKKTAIATALSTMLLVATAPVQAGSAADAVAIAKAALAQAASVGGEWRDTGKMIKKAEALLAEGKDDDAMKMAKKAEMQGRSGYAQAINQTADKLHI